MANHLKMAMVQAIQILRARGWSYRRIGRELGIHRDTARRHVELAAAASIVTSIATPIRTARHMEQRGHIPVRGDRLRNGE